jgi:hypothetical protein
MASFQVLHRLAHLVDDRREVKADAGQARVLGPGAGRVGLAVAFPGAEVERPAGGFGLRQQPARGRDLGGQAIESFGSVGAYRQERQFRRAPRRIGRGAGADRACAR